MSPQRRSRRSRSRASPSSSGCSITTHSNGTAHRWEAVARRAGDALQSQGRGGGGGPHEERYWKKRKHLIGYFFGGAGGAGGGGGGIQPRGLPATIRGSRVREREEIHGKAQRRGGDDA